MKYLKDDIDFLEQILEKVESRNMHDQLEGYGMLRDQISNMPKRHLTNKSSGQEELCGLCKRAKSECACTSTMF